MARGLNHALLVGTLVQPPELRYTPAGLAVLQLDLAGDDHVHGADGEPRRLAWYHRATVFGAQAEMIADRLEVAMPVLVDGRLEQRSWHTDDGERRSTLDVVAARVEALRMGARGEEATHDDARGQPRLRDAVNRVRLLGNLTRDAEHRVTSNGHALTRFGVALNERFRDRQGQQSERTHFVEVQAWRSLGEATAELAKGDGVYAEGRLVTDRWEDDEGRRRFAARVEAQRVEWLLGPPAAQDRAVVGASGEARDAGLPEEAPF